MDAVTYPSGETQHWLREKLIPLRVSHDHEPLADEFAVLRTPCLVLLNGDRSEIHRSEEVLTPGDFSAFIQLGIAKMSYRRGELEAAMDLLNGLVGSHPESSSAPEAIALRGRCRYKYTQDIRHLKDAHEQLRAEFPRSRWTRLTFQYRLL